MKAFLAIFALVPLALARPDTGSYTSFSLHGQSYGYGHGKAHEGPLYYHQTPAHEPATHKPEPSYKPEPTYKPEPYQPYHPEPAYKPEPYHPEPAYKPEPYHPAPAYPQPHYGYEQPKHNCSVEEVTEIAEVCTPAFETNCENVELPIKKIVDGEYCYDSARTVCTETIENIDNEVCSYEYNKKYEDTTAQTVEVTFEKETKVQMVTVCQPGYGHGYHSYGHQYCKEVAQETAYNVPKVNPSNVSVRVGYPEPAKVCVNKPIALPRVSCETVTERKCVSQPEIMDDTVSVEKCSTKLGAPSCQKIELTLPRQVCVELVYGYAEETPKHYGQ